MVHLVDSILPVRVVMLLQLPLVSPRLNHQAAIAVINVLHGGPGSHNPVGGSEGEVVEVLVERVPGGPGARIRWLVDQHGVDSSDVRPGETLHVVKNIRRADILKLRKLLGS